jgi:phosphoadenosine phosphosulfate reductase
MSEQQCIAGCGLSLDELVEASVGLLQQFEPADKYYGCFSGGKDSVVIKHLAKLAGVRIRWHYNVTTIDPPELVRFIRREHPDVMWLRPEEPFFVHLVKRGFPTRVARWCCEEYKERRSPPGAVLVLGIRAEESPRRAARWRDVTWHTKAREWMVSPILRWTTEDVWTFIRREGLAYCSLYDEGFDRLGCIGCPMAGRAGKLAQFARWPGYERLWKRAFRLLWEMRKGTEQRNGKEWMGSAKWDSWEQMWSWWLNDEPMPRDNECQLDMWS